MELRKLNMFFGVHHAALETAEELLHLGSVCAQSKDEKARARSQGSVVSDGLY